MEASRFRSLDGVLGAVSGLCEALSEIEYRLNVGDVPPGDVYSRKGECVSQRG